MDDYVYEIVHTRYDNVGHPCRPDTKQAILPYDAGTGFDPAPTTAMATVDELRQMLVRTSWWAEPRTWILRDLDLIQARKAPFEYSAGVLGNLVPGGLYLLRGPRRVGKSVELKKTIERLISSGEDPRRIVHLAADRLVAGDLQRVVDAAALLTPRTGRRFWFIDEITAITDGWPAAIKWLRDNDARFGLDTVVLTGSSAANLDEAVKALAGRRGGAEKSDRVLLPMPFRAFVRACSEDPPPDDPEPVSVADLTPALFQDAVVTLAPWLNQIIEQWEGYLAVGGFPQAVSAHITDDDRARRTLLQTLLDVIHGEAFVQSRWSKAQSGAFVARLARGLASPTNRHDIAMDLDTSANTVRRRIDALRDALTVWPCHPCQPRGVLRPALRAQEKIYFTDPVYSVLSHHTASPSNLGALSEQQLGVALLRSFARSEPEAYPNFDSVLYYRTPARKEVDFVGPAFGNLAIESKYVDQRRWRRDARTLAASRWRGVMATRSALDLNDPDLTAVPTGLLVWLIGG